MKNFLKVVGLSLIDAVIIIIILISIVRLHIPMTGIYVVYGGTAILFPLILLLIYNRFFGRETLIVVPLSLVLAMLYSLGVSIYSYFGTSSFSLMFKELMYFIYFLPSIIYCGAGWIIFAIFSRMLKTPHRREL